MSKHLRITSLMMTIFITTVIISSCSDHWNETGSSYKLPVDDPRLSDAISVPSAFDRYDLFLSGNGFGRQKHQISNSIDIIPFVGVGNLVLAESNFKDVERLFGRGKKKWNYVTIFDLGEFYLERTINYPDLGITIAADRLYHSSKFAIARIEMNSSCKFKTKMGNGIGSSLHDLRQEFDSIRVIHWNGSEGYLEAFVTNNWVTDVSFKCYSTTDTSQFVVENISMSYLR